MRPEVCGGNAPRARLFRFRFDPSYDIMISCTSLRYFGSQSRRFGVALALLYLYFTISYVLVHMILIKLQKPEYSIYFRNGTTAFSRLVPSTSHARARNLNRDLHQLETGHPSVMTRIGEISS